MRNMKSYKDDFMKTKSLETEKRVIGKDKN